MKAASRGILTLLLAGCAAPRPTQTVDGGDPSRGRAAALAYGCGACHDIPGIREAAGRVGPSLDHWSDRRFIAGVMPNDPARLITWLTVPQAILPGSAMPDMGVSDADARDIAAYLYTLR